MNPSRSTFLILTIVLSGCVAVTPQIRLPGPYSDKGVTVSVDGLWKDGNGNVSGISGVAVNNGSKDLTLCMITLDLLDASGVKVSSAMASTNGLKSGQQWRFQATFLTQYSVSFTSIEPGTVTVM